MDLSNIPLFKAKINRSSFDPMIERANLRMNFAGIDKVLYLKFSEKMLKTRITGHNSSIPCSNGTAALYLAFRCLSPKLIISQSYTYKAIRNAAKLAGIDLVYLPSTYEGEQFFLPSLIDLRHYSQEEGVCIVLTPMHGVAISREYIFSVKWMLPKATIILDKAQLASQDDYFADLSTYSFIQNKEITCGEGGAISFNNESLYCKIIDMINQEGEWGFNFRLSNLSLEFLINELGYYWVYYEERMKLLKIYNSHFGPLNTSRYRTMYFIDNPNGVSSLEGINIRAYPDLITGEMRKMSIPYYLDIEPVNIERIYLKLRMLGVVV